MVSVITNAKPQKLEKTEMLEGFVSLNAFFFPYADVLVRHVYSYCMQRLLSQFHSVAAAAIVLPAFIPEHIITNSLNSTRVSPPRQWLIHNWQVYNKMEINRTQACHWLELSTETSRTHDSYDSNDGAKDITTWTEPSVG